MCIRDRLQYHNLWKNIVNDQIPEGWQSYKGFAIRSGVAAYSKGSYMKKTKKEKEIPQINLWYLDKIRKLCEKNKIQLLLYTSASPVNHNYKRYNAVLKYCLLYTSYLQDKKTEQLKQAAYYFGIIFLFAIGAGLGGNLTEHFGIHMIWISCILLGLSFLLMFENE